MTSQFKNKKIITFFTSSRADYDLIKNLINFFLIDKKFRVHLIITGTHFSKKYGKSYDQIYKKNLKIIPIKLNIKISTPKNIVELSSIYLNKFQKYFNNYKPEATVVLGDRYEAFLLSYCSFINLTKVIHLHGGELSLGAYDDSLRHSISKFSHLHFVSHEQYKKRLIQIGENKSNIFKVGAFAVDNIYKFIDLPDFELSKIVKFDVKKNKFLLVTYHPETLIGSQTIKNFKILLNSLEYFKNLKIVINVPNADTYSEDFIKLIIYYVKKNNNFIYIKNLGSKIFFSIMKKSLIYIGNSSSGIIESPYLKTYFLLVGDRQRGRVLSKNIIKIKPFKNEIINAIRSIIKKRPISKIIYTFGKNYVANRTYKNIVNNLNKIKFVKKFGDINF